MTRWASARRADPAERSCTGAGVAAGAYGLAMLLRCSRSPRPMPSSRCPLRGGRHHRGRAGRNGPPRSRARDRRAAAGAWVGDNASYLAGRTLGRPVARRLFSGQKAQATDVGARPAPRARDVHRRRGALHPGRAHRRRLHRRPRPLPLADALRAGDRPGGAHLGVYASLLGYPGGRIFVDRPLLALGVAARLRLRRGGRRRGSCAELRSTREAT